ncbi:hypothetical protein EDB85DRAFT_1893702 [Lactarius pseudohatsudake]|nr:hypothetical protein EDB85DRAFT_1893702 [Lactarius pseudohatsudake]
MPVQPSPPTPTSATLPDEPVRPPPDQPVPNNSGAQIPSADPGTKKGRRSYARSGKMIPGGQSQQGDFTQHWNELGKQAKAEYKQKEKDAKRGTSVRVKGPPEDHYSQQPNTFRLVQTFWVPHAGTR